MKRLLPALSAILGLAIGIGATHAYHVRVASREAETIRVMSALERIATAQATIALLKKQRPDALSDWCTRTVIENIGVAHEGIVAGVSLRDQIIPNLAEGVLRASASLRESGAPPEVLVQAAAVLEHLAGPAAPRP
jgi:hypothetical protein